MGFITPALALTTTTAAGATVPSALGVGLAVAGGTAALAEQQRKSASKAAFKSTQALQTLQTTPSVQTKIQSEADSARKDLEQRLRQAGSRGKSNQGIPQLQPLPNFQGPQLAGRLG